MTSNPSLSADLITISSVSADNTVAAPSISIAGMLRVNMRITDAATTEYLWAGRHEFRPEELAPIQTKITRRISRELHVLLLQEASRRAAEAKLQNEPN